MDLDEDSEQSWGCSLRVKVQIEVTSPLKHENFLKSRSKGEEKWISITYEKLPDFNGHLGHTTKERVNNSVPNEDNLP